MARFCKRTADARPGRGHIGAFYSPEHDLPIHYALPFNLEAADG